MNNPPKKYANGCLWLIVALILGAIGFGVASVFLDINSVLLFLFTFAFAIFLSTKVVGKPKLSSVIINLVITFVFLAVIATGLTFVFGWLTPKPDTAVFDKDEAIEKTVLVEGMDTVQIYASDRIWRDNYGNNFTATLAVRDRDYQRLKNHLRTYNPNSSRNFWGNLYDYIDRTDTPSLDLIMDAMRAIQQEKRLNQMEFAEMVVSCIQDIPYSYVFQEACMPAENYEYTIRSLLEQCPECCIGNIMYGIQNPVSFIQNLKGDCDTRTVIIYSILKHFGYDVAILNSEFYRHSILGINLPVKGESKIYNGKRYFVWETTAKYFEAGNLPKTYDDISYWDVVLTSK